MVHAASGGIMAWGIYSWHTSRPLVTIKHRLNDANYLDIVADHMLQIMTPVQSSSCTFVTGQGTVSQIKNSRRVVHRKQYYILC